jgi:hypothetical protein
MFEFEVGQFVACKYRGNNGDLIVGAIIAKGLEGDQLILRNRLTGSLSVKSSKVLSRRNYVLEPHVAARITQRFDKEGKAAARELAVEIYEARVADKKGTPDDIDPDGGDRVFLVSTPVLVRSPTRCSNLCAYISAGYIRTRDGDSTCVPRAYCDLFDEHLTELDK